MSTSLQKFGSRGCIFKDIFSYLNVLHLKLLPHSNRVQYLHETDIGFHCNDNIHSAVKPGTRSRRKLFLFPSLLLSFYEFCVSDGSFIIWLLQYLSQRGMRSLSQCFYNIRKVPTVRFRKNENDVNILQIIKMQEQKR